MVVRGIQEGGISIVDFKDVTPIPTNGCKPPAARRL
jgi:ribosomal protein S11